jgi:hypothetical protein
VLQKYYNFRERPEIEAAERRAVAIPERKSGIRMSVERGRMLR